MQIHPDILKSADHYYDNIAINDFSSFIKSDFKDDVLIDLSPERAQENDRLSRAFLGEMDEISRKRRLSDDERAVVEAMEDFAHYIRSNSRFYDYKFNLTHNTCPLQYVIKRLATYPLESGEDLERYVRLIAQLPSTIAGMRQKLQRQKERGILMHPEELTISVRMVESFRQMPDSPLLPQNRGLEVPPQTQTELARILRRTNEQLEELLRYMSGQYPDGAACRGLWESEEGRAYYDSLIYTSYNYDPQELYDIGLEELSKTKAKMRSIIRELGFDGSIAAFDEQLQRDPRFFDNSPEELENRFRRYLDGIRPLLQDYFPHLPEADCDVRAIPPHQESATSWGYYSVPIGTEKKGIFYCSAAELDKRNQIRTAAITYHELLPGHHFQVNLIAEDKTLPKILQNHFNTAFADGWAEYASDLAGEMGLYDLYDLYGRYIWDAVLCVRLVVDSGLNGLGWDLARARQFMREHTILTPGEIHTETLRYAVDMPGQALAYKMGSLKHHALRRRAQSALAGAFDLKGYHDVVLKYGSTPLYLLEKNVERYINTEKRRQ